MVGLLVIVNRAPMLIMATALMVTAMLVIGIGAVAEEVARVVEVINALGVGAITLGVGAVAEAVALGVEAVAEEVAEVVDVNIDMGP